ncbi:MAG: tryptophan synthase subunit beta [Saccharofermentanales bacterium]
MNPDGKYGPYGGQYIPEALMSNLQAIDHTYQKLKGEAAFTSDFHGLLRDYVGRPSLLYEAKSLTRALGGARIFLKREDLNHTGAHKINNALGQALLAVRMGKKRLIAETGAGQHGVAAATAAALLGLDCLIFMGAKDIERQRLNVFRMELLGARVKAVETGTQVLKDAVNACLAEWAASSHDTYYLLGSAVGPHPFPAMVRDFQSVIGQEARQQILEREERLPDAVIACCGGGSNAIGIFTPFIEDREVQLIGCEAAGLGLDTPEHAATLTRGRPGIFHGMKTYFNQDAHGQIAPVYSLSAGLDYPGVGPEHAWLRDTGRASYVAVTDQETLAAFELLARTEGIIPALESSHALAHAMDLAPRLSQEAILLVNLSGRGDKDVAAIAQMKGRQTHESN